MISLRGAHLALCLSGIVAPAGAGCFASENEVVAKPIIKDGVKFRKSWTPTYENVQKDDSFVTITQRQKHLLNRFRFDSAKLREWESIASSSYENEAKSRGLSLKSVASPFPKPANMNSTVVYTDYVRVDTYLGNQRKSSQIFGQLENGDNLIVICAAKADADVELFGTICGAAVEQAFRENKIQIREGD